MAALALSTRSGWGDGWGGGWGGGWSDGLGDGWSGWWSDALRVGWIRGGGEPTEPQEGPQEAALGPGGDAMLRPRALGDGAKVRVRTPTHRLPHLRDATATRLQSDARRRG